MKGHGKIILFCFVSVLLLWELSSCYEQYPYFIQVPEFSLYTDSWSGELFLNIYTPDRGNRIRYTTDGSDPSESYGIQYEGSILLSGKIYVKATAYREGYPAGPVSDFYYDPDGQ